MNLQWHCSGRAYGFVKRAHGELKMRRTVDITSSQAWKCDRKHQSLTDQLTEDEDEDEDGALQGMDYWKLSGSVK